MSKQTFEQPIPRGWETFTLGIRVAGIHYRLDFADVALSGNDDPQAFIKPEPDNEHDENAIQVFVNRTNKIFGLIPLNTNFHIGYVPDSLAAVLAELELQYILKTRVKSVYRNDKGKITSVIIDLIGPSKIYTDNIKKSIDECAY